MQLIKGVDFFLCYKNSTDDEPQIIGISEKSQLIGALDAGQTMIRAVINAEAVDHVFGVLIDQKTGSISLKRDLIKSNPLLTLMAEPGDRWHKTEVPVVDDKNFIPTTKYPRNYMSLVEFDTLSPGLVRIWEVALISQRGVFHVTVQCVYEVRCYRSGEEMACPFFEHEKPRPEFVKFFKEKLADQLSLLPSVEEYKTPPPPTMVSPGQARVLWWRCAEGLGVVETPDGVTARLHWSNVEEEVYGLVRFEPGDIISYGKIGSPTKTYPRETGFSLEIYEAYGFEMHSDD